MTPQVMAYVASHGNEGKVLEVGSLDVNGSVRHFYKDYIGIDLREGKGVDLVYKDKIPFDDETFDKVLYLETMEHDLYFWKTIEEMVRVLKKGGKLIITARGYGFPKHDFPNDFYRFSDQSLVRLMLDHLTEVVVTEETGDGGVFGCGVKS